MVINYLLTGMILQVPCSLSQVKVTSPPDPKLPLEDRLHQEHLALGCLKKLLGGENPGTDGYVVNNQWIFLVPLKGGRFYIITQLALYTTYILPSRGLYATYHLLREPETTIEITINTLPRANSKST